MKISENCISLITKWEGFKHNAYRCPAGVPTIGYGTTHYPDGKKVELGDTICKQKAEACLHSECNKDARDVTKVVNANVKLNQNQFDALVSFTYNLGIGSLKESTLLKKVNAGKFDEAAKEFDKWVYATVHGVKKKLPGLVDRRRDERLLFERVGGEKPAINREDSPQESVTWLEGFRDNDETVVVAWNGGKVVEILTLESHSKKDLISLLQHYPNAKNFLIAPSGKKLPDGKRIPVAGAAKPIEKVINPPTLQHSLLARGMNDADDAGKDIKELQNRLHDLGYYSGNIDGDFNKVTDIAVRDFQEDYFGAGEADGKVGKLTWEKLWGDVQNTDHKINHNSTIPGKNYLKLTKTSRKDQYGCYVLDLTYYKDGMAKESLKVCSGLKTHQYFRTGAESRSGTYEPLPEGKWYMHDIRWNGGKDNYHAKPMLAGIGPVTVALDYKAPGSTQRKNIEIHIDYNRKTSPGTAGCIGLYNVGDYKKFVSWLRDSNPRDLYVDWNLGTCPHP